MATTTAFGWSTPDDTSLVKDGAAAIRTLGQSIDTSMAELKGGTTGQVLSKTSNTDMDFTWVAQDDSNAIQNAIVDAKGDLIAASANDTPARLAVGNNGETLVADSSTSTGLRYQAPVQQNPVLNSAFQVWQRGTTYTYGGSVAYTADRWNTDRVGGGASSYTITRQVTNDTTNLPNIQYAARVQRAAGNTATGAIYFNQPIETINSIPFVGKVVTVSFYARAGANYSASSSILAASLISGTGTDQNYLSTWTGAATSGSLNATLTTTWQRFQFTGTVATTATELTIPFVFTPTGTAGANDYFEVTGVQLEVGSIATPFHTFSGTIQGETSACQRYYYRTTGQVAAANDLTTGFCNSTTSAVGVVRPPVTMRIAPTCAFGAAGDFVFVWSAGASTISAAQIDRSSVDSINLRLTTSGLTTGQGGYLALNTGTTKYLEMSAEL